MGAGSSQSPSVPPCPLGGAQTSKWSLPNLFRGQEGGRGQPWLKKTQGRGEVITMETFGGERGQSIMIRMKLEELVANITWSPSFSLPEGLPAPILVLLLCPGHQEDFAHILLLLHLLHGIRHLLEGPHRVDVRFDVALVV